MLPHRRQPTRLPCPWDSPGKNTGVGCHFLLQRVKVKSESEVDQSCPTLSDPMDCSPLRLLRPWDFPGKSTGVGCHCLLLDPGKTVCRHIWPFWSSRCTDLYLHSSSSAHLQVGAHFLGSTAGADLRIGDLETWGHGLSLPLTMCPWGSHFTP